MSKKKRSFPAIPAALFSMMSVQGGGAIAKSLFPHIGASGTATLRIGISSIILFLINRPKISSLTSKQWAYSFGYGACLGLMNLSFYLAIERIPLGLGVTIEFLGPLALALILSRRFLDVVWALLACGGILLIAPWQSDGIDIIGIVFGLGAGLFWAFYIILGGKISKIMKTGDGVTIGMAFATLLILPFGIIGGGLAALNWKLLATGTGVALFSSAIPYSLDLVALNKLPAKTFSILMSLQPAFAALSGLIFLSEMLELNQWLSIVCVITASIGATLTAYVNKKTM
ncbi:MAG: DMT family transporter [Bacteroidales bacterium]|jgi:inner membrane transporter RhtA|nr:DMT family transporter [Bacteroidales bacterium]